MGERYADKIFDYIKNMLEDSNYTNQVIVNLVDSMPDYRIPYNYSYSSNRNYSLYDLNKEGVYVRDTLGWTKDEIDTILDGNSDSYWNID